MKIFLSFVLIVFLIAYIYVLKFYIPTDFISYENYHGITFLNDIYGNIAFGNYKFILNYIYSVLLQDNVGPIHGYVPRIIYGYIYNYIDYLKINIFVIQSFLSLISYLFFSYLIYILFNKNIKAFLIIFILFLTSINQIRYGFSEDFYILGNLFISISLVSYTLFLLKEEKIYKFINFFFFIFFYVLSIYTRNLYLLYIPIYFIIWLYVYFSGSNKKKFINYPYLIYLLFTILILIYPILDRYLVLSGLHDYFTKNIGNTGKIKLLFDAENNFMLYLIIIGYSIFFFLKKGYKRLLLSLLIFYFLYLLNTYLIMSGLEIDKFNRHFLLLEPLYIFILALSIYSIYLFFSKYIKNKNLFENAYFLSFILLLLLIPIYNIDYFRKKFIVNEEYKFIVTSHNLLGDDFNFILPGQIGESNYAFPLFIFHNKNLYNFSRESYYYSSFLVDYNWISDDNNILYYPSACYELSHFDKDLKDDCKYIKEEFNMVPIVEKEIIGENYIIPEFPDGVIKVGFYKILGRK